MSIRCMRNTLILSLFLWSLILYVCFASPFVVCDPYVAGDEVDEFTVIMEPGCQQTVENVPAEVLTDGTTRLHYDVENVAQGNHIMAVAARNIYGIESTYSYFSFSKTCGCGECTYQ